MWVLVWRWGAPILAMSILFSILPTTSTGTDADTDTDTDTVNLINKIQYSPSPDKTETLTLTLTLTLEYDFYRHKCPLAESIIRSTTGLLYSRNASVAPALLRLLFHDCFIQGCDGSVLLERAINGSDAERDAVPNQTLKGFDEIELVKSKVEEACPGVVSCADVLALAARDGVVLSGGPFYPVLTGRRDSTGSYFDEASSQIPAPGDDFEQTISKFGSRGFTEMETVAILGAHSVGRVNCQFFEDRLYNFSGTGAPDGSIDPDRLEEMRAACAPTTTTGSPRAAADRSLVMGMQPDERGRTGRFDSYYYNSLLEARGILRSDQQLTAGRTVRWVKAYADGERGFRGDFARAMAKLTALKPLLGSEGQVRVRCSGTV